MPYSSQYLAQIVVVLAFFLPKIGVTLGNDQVTVIAQALVIIGGVAWTLYQRTLLKKVGKENSDTTLAGTHK